MANPFQEVVETFSGLKTKFQAGEISRQQFIDEMKKLRLKDDQGRYWMIGAQTGKWYYFDGNDWVQAEPPSQKENKAICIYCGFENKIEVEVCGRCGGNLVEGAEPEDRCSTCGSALVKPLMTCPRCASKDEGLRSVEFIQLGGAADVKGEVFVLKYINPLSALLVFGVLGLIGGVLYGALAGAVGSLVSFMASWPPIIREASRRSLLPSTPFRHAILWCGLSPEVWSSRPRRTGACSPRPTHPRRSLTASWGRPRQPA